MDVCASERLLLLSVLGVLLCFGLTGGNYYTSSYLFQHYLFAEQKVHRMTLASTRIMQPAPYIPLQNLASVILTQKKTDTFNGNMNLLCM